MNIHVLNRFQAAKRFVPDSLIKRRATYLDRKREPDGFNLISGNARYKDRHKGQRCFIVGNGPSLNLQDLSLLDGEAVFTCNRFIQSAQYHKFSSTYHLWMDYRFFSQDFNTKAGSHLLNIIKSAKTEKSDPEVFFDVSARKMLVEHSIDKSIRVAYLFESHHYDFSKHDEIDLCMPLPHMPTVVQHAICVALYMGFEEIYLIGCDCTGFIATANTLLGTLDGSTHYAYPLSGEDEETMRLLLADSKIRNELDNYVELFDNYSLLLEKCERCGVKLRNATYGGLLDGVPRIAFESLVGAK